MTFTRRRFLGTGAAALGAAGLPLPALAQGEFMPATGKRAVVIGGGWGGNTAAKYIRMQDPSIEVVLVEQFQRMLFVLAHQRRESGHVGEHDRGEFTVQFVLHVLAFE